MTRHVVIGTAGHVDHGKSALVLALTGTDPDRWAEEKRRGITIDLGFAHLPLTADLEASIVDVPGHEDFVRNMVAGATGVDVALLVVAADEGVMPQTIEHLAILDYLGVRAGVVALTKADLVEPEWLGLVREDLGERLATHGVRWEAIVPVSSVSGVGLDDLRSALERAAADAPPRAPDDLFRMPVDRVFSVAGAGTVVTGTVWTGTVRLGDTVRFLPSSLAGRVRSIEVHGQARPEALPGRRTAIAVTSIERTALERGEVAVSDPSWRPTDVLDVRVRMLPGARPLTQRTRVRVHLGTAEVLARVTPGDGDVVRLRLEQPIAGRWGDRGVLRAYSPVTTVGGFVVLDPWPAPRPRRPVHAHALGGEGRLLAAVRLAGDAGLDRGVLPVQLGLAANGSLPAEILAVGDRLVLVERVGAVRDAVLAVLSRHHAARPDLPGLPREALRQEVGPLADHATAELVSEGRVLAAGADLRLVDHAERLPAADGARADALLAGLDAARFEGLGPDAADPRLAEFLVRAGLAVRLGRDRYYLPAHLDAMVAIARALLEAGEVPPAAFREKLGLSRKFLIPFLEWLDQEGYSVRVGDSRQAGHRLKTL